MTRRHQTMVGALWLAGGGLCGCLSGFQDSRSFLATVQPFLAKNCFLCHNAKLQTAGLNLEGYTTAASVAQDRSRWERIIQRLEADEMPPAGVPRPDRTELHEVVKWVRSQIGGAEPASGVPAGRVTIHRLNRAEYNNTVRDLLGVDLHPADEFPPDDSGYGFDVIADVLSLPPVLLEMYVSAAEKTVRAALFGPAPLKPTSVIFEDVRIRGGTNYSFTEYDRTGLTLPGSVHVQHRFPVEAEYEFSMLPVGSRPSSSEPVKMAVWVDGKLAKSFVVSSVRDGPGHPEVYRQGQQFRTKVTAGDHWVAVTYLDEFDGLPARFHGSNPSRQPDPPPPDSTVIQPPPALTPEQAADFRRRVEEGLRGQNQKVSTLTANLTINGPFNPNTGPSQETLSRILGCDSFGCVSEPPAQRLMLSRFMRRAFRRPVKNEEVDRYASLIAMAQKGGGSLQEGIAAALEAVLVSPAFLFRIEERGAPGGPRPISTFELASRLSYFLWSTMPDEELSARADDGSLASREVLEAQVRRMLRDPKCRAFVENFGGQWLETRKLESVDPNGQRFPEFDPYLRMSMQRETEMFFENVIREDRSIFEFLDAKYTFVNERLAQHYGLSGVKGPEFRKVDLSGTPRTGVLGQGGILTVTAYATRTSPVIRGKWILSNLLNRPPPPPPNVPSLEQSSAGPHATVREQLEKHRENPVCASCHVRMDPLGFALENYDAIGAWRTEDGKQPIDATGVLPDGRRLDGPAGLMKALEADRSAFADCLIRKMLMYALGRGLEPADKSVVDGIGARMASHQYSFSSLVTGIVLSTPFGMRQDSGP